MEKNRTPVLVHPYSPGRGLEQLAPYDQIYVLAISPESSMDTLAESSPSEIVAMLEVSPSDLDQDYYPPKLVASYRISKLYHLQRRMPLVRDPADPVKVPFNMFWYW